MNHPEPILFTSDHHGFYLGGSPFYPQIQDGFEPLMDWSNTVIIRLAAHLSDDLNWSREKAIAETIAKAGKYILWEIDLGLDSYALNPEDSASFYSFSLAIEEFCKQLWPTFGNVTFGAALYRGPFPFEQWKSSLRQELAEGDQELLYVQLFSEYLHRLVSFLPDALLPFALIDIQQIESMAKGAQLLSKVRFEYVNLAIKGAKAPFSGICWETGYYGQGWLANAPRMAPLLTARPAVGVYFPDDEWMSRAVIEQLDSLMEDLKRKKVDFRIVAEERLADLWDGLDTLIVPPSAISVSGKRKLQGFIAAGGIVEEITIPF
jgi:hypothetical protein